MKNPWMLLYFLSVVGPSLGRSVCKSYEYLDVSDDLLICKNCTVCADLPEFGHQRRKCSSTHDTWCSRCAVGQMWDDFNSKCVQCQPASDCGAPVEVRSEDVRKRSLEIVIAVLIGLFVIVLSFTTLVWCWKRRKHSSRKRPGYFWKGREVLHGKEELAKDETQVAFIHPPPLEDLPVENGVEMEMEASNKPFKDDDQDTSLQALESLSFLTELSEIQLPRSSSDLSRIPVEESLPFGLQESVVFETQETRGTETSMGTFISEETSWGGTGRQMSSFLTQGMHPWVTGTPMSSFLTLGMHLRDTENTSTFFESRETDTETLLSEDETHVAFIHPPPLEDIPVENVSLVRSPNGDDTYPKQKPAAQGSASPPDAEGSASPPDAEGSASPPDAEGSATPPDAEGSASPPDAEGSASPPDAQYCNGVTAVAQDSTEAVCIYRIDESFGAENYLEPDKSLDGGETERTSESGNHTIFYSNIMLIGHENSGKTSLVDSLLGVEFDSFTASCLDPLECKITTTYAQATPMGFDRQDMPLHTQIRQQLDGLDPPDNEGESCMSSTQNSKRNRVTYSGMKIVDISGNILFYKCHQMLFAPNTVFVLTLDATRALDETLPQLCDGDISQFDYPKTSREFLDFWLGSISTFMGKLVTEKVTPCIVIVLTHADLLEVQSQMGEIEREILDHLKTQYANRYVFPIIHSLSNRERLDRDVTCLTVDLHRLCQSRPTFGQEQPCSWLGLANEIDQYCELSGRRYLTLQELQDNIAVKLDFSPEDIKKYLIFHSNQGNLVFLNDGSMDSLVITDPQILPDALKAVCQLRNVKYMGFSISCQCELRDGLKFGVISEDNLLQALRDVQCSVTKEFKHLVTILVRLGQFILYEESPKQYIVPALLTAYDPTEVPLGPCKSIPRAETLVYLFHRSKDRSNERIAKLSGFLPDDMLFLLVSSLVRNSGDRLNWEVVKIFSNAAAFRVGSRSQFVLIAKRIASVFCLDIYMVGNLKFEGQICEVSVIRSALEAHIKDVIQSMYPRVYLSVCVPTCSEFIETLKKHQYGCLQILGKAGEVGRTKPLKTALCHEHGKDKDTEEHISCWFCIEINKRKKITLMDTLEDNQGIRDQKLLNSVADKVLDLSMLTSLGLELGVSMTTTTRRYEDSGSKIKLAAFNVLCIDWYDKEGGYLIQGSASLLKLQAAIKAVGLTYKLLQI